MDLFCSGIALMAVGSNVPNIVLYLLIVTSSVVLAYYIFLKARHNYFYCSYSTVYIVPFIVPLYTVVCTLRALLNPMMNMNAVSGDTEFIIGAIKCYQLLANQTES